MDSGLDHVLLDQRRREALLVHLARRAAVEIGRELAAAGLEHGPAAEAVKESIQIFASAAVRYPQLLDAPASPPEIEQVVAEPFRAVLERARADGAIRDDVPLEQLGDSLRGLLSGTLRAVQAGGAELSGAGTAVARLFLEAARPPSGAPAAA